MLAVVLLSSCNKYEDDINEIKTEIAEIKDALSELQDAYSSGKIISSVTALEGEAAGGWIITF
jgi:chaperonin cofactor prefoldin